jgi:hypothetical protein
MRNKVSVKSNKIQKPNENKEGVSRKLSPSDFYIEDGKYVFTEKFHLKRGFCCNSICRHCPYKGKLSNFENTGGKHQKQIED